MTTTTLFDILLVCCLLGTSAFGFSSGRRRFHTIESLSSSSGNDDASPPSARLVFMSSKNDSNEEQFNFPNPFREVADMFKSMDDVVDDFFNKRMGNGEIFYGKRKYKPSGNVEGDYNGMGLTDKLKIDITRQRKEEWLEEKRLREEVAADGQND